MFLECRILCSGEVGEGLYLRSARHQLHRNRARRPREKSQGRLNREVRCCPETHPCRIDVEWRQSLRCSGRVSKFSDLVTSFDDAERRIERVGSRTHSGNMASSACLVISGPASLCDAKAGSNQGCSIADADLIATPSRGDAISLACLCLGEW